MVLASGGYPGAYQTGKPITGIADAEAEGATVFHAGTRAATRGLETAGGRVLGVTASRRRSCQLPWLPRTPRGAKIHFDGMHYRQRHRAQRPETLQ